MKIISGDYEPTEEEAHWTDSEDEDDDEEEEKKPEAKKDDAGSLSMIQLSTSLVIHLNCTAPVKGIPQFWLTALQRSDLVSSVCPMM